MTIDKVRYTPKKFGAGKIKKQKWYKNSDLKMLRAWSVKQNTSVSRIVRMSCLLYIDTIAVKILSARSVGNLPTSFLPRPGKAKADSDKTLMEISYEEDHIVTFKAIAEKLVKIGYAKRITFSGIVDSAIELYFKKVINEKSVHRVIN